MRTSEPITAPVRAEVCRRNRGSARPACQSAWSMRTRIRRTARISARGSLLCSSRHPHRPP
eukprot:2953617-Prymnesium_polylepis.2